MKIDPARAYFGQVSRTSPEIQKTIKITRGDGGSLKPKLKPGKEDGVEAKLREIEPGEKYELDVTLSTPLKSERLTSRLALETGVPEAPIVHIPVYAVVTPRVTANPKRVVVPRERAKDWEKKVRLRWDDGTPSKILSVSINSPQLSAEIDETGPPSSAQDIVVKALEEEVPPGNYTLLIKTDDAVMPEVKVLVRAGLPVPSRGTEVEPSTSALPDKTKHAAPTGKPVPAPAVEKAKVQTAQP